MLTTPCRPPAIRMHEKPVGFRAGICPARHGRTAQRSSPGLQKNDGDEDPKGSHACDTRATNCTQATIYMIAHYPQKRAYS